MTTSVQAPPGVPESIHRRRWLILAILLSSVLVVVLDTSILNVALKRIAEPKPDGLGASQAALEWSLNAYTLVFAGLLFTSGVLGDRLGRKPILMIGMFIFGVSSLASAFAADPTQLIVFRSLMGVGGALITPATLAVLVSVFGPEERARAIGIWSGVVGLAVALGPILGGALLHWFWWGSVFLINVPVAAIAIVLMMVFVPNSKDHRPGRFDPIGVLLSIIGLVALVYGVIKGGQLGRLSDPQVWIPVLVGVGVLGLWVVAERRLKEPAFDVHYFHDRRFSASITAIAVMAFGLNGVVFFFVFYTQSVRGYSALQTGLLLLPMALAQMFFAPRARHVVARFGARVTCSSALALMGVAFLGFVLLDADSPIWIMEVCFFLIGLGTAHVLPPATVMVMSSLPPQKAGSASAINNVFRQVGAALGIAVLGALLSYVYRHSVADSLGQLPTAIRLRAEQSIEATLSVVRTPDLIAAADNAFVHAMHVTAVLSAAVSFLGALITLMFFPAKAALAPAPAPAPPPTAPSTLDANVHTTSKVDTPQ